MREIKFRGHTGQEWVYGCLIHWTDPKGKKMAQIEETDIEHSLAWFVAPESVGQWTGLVDGNEVDVYEGDIVSFPSELNAFYRVICEDLRIKEKSTVVSSVFFEDGCFAFNFQNGYEGGEVSWSDVEVIGNAFEHPELVK